MLAAAPDVTPVVAAIVGATGVILAVLLPLLIRTNRHARGAYDQTNRIDEVMEPGGEGSAAPNLRQMIDRMGHDVTRGFRRNDEQHAEVHQMIGGLHEEIRATRAELREHAEDESLHPWKQK